MVQNSDFTTHQGRTKSKGGCTKIDPGSEVGNHTDPNKPLRLLHGYKIFPVLSGDFPVLCVNFPVLSVDFPVCFVEFPALSADFPKCCILCTKIISMNF